MSLSSEKGASHPGPGGKRIPALIKSHQQQVGACQAAGRGLIQVLPLRKHPGRQDRHWLLGKVLMPGGGNESLTESPARGRPQPWEEPGCLGRGQASGGQS